MSQYCFLGVHAVGGLLEDDALRPVDHLVGDLLAAVGRQTVHEKRPFLRVLQEFRVHLVGGEGLFSFPFSASKPMLYQTSV